MANDRDTRGPAPHPALRRLQPLVGTWEIRGRTLGAQEDNISGRVDIEWLPGGFFLQQRGWMRLKDVDVHSLELVGYDAAAEAFPAYVYSSMGGTPAPFQWEVQGSTIIHRGMGATFRGALSGDGRTITGGWRPDAGEEGTDGAAYDAVMTRVDRPR